MKKLYRDNKDKRFLGVCSGIGVYFAIDANVIRIIFLIAMTFNYFLFIIYIICGIIIPIDDDIID